MRGVVWLLLLYLTSSGAASHAATVERATRAPLVSTFSIVARDPETGDFGVAVQSRYFSVGSVVPHARAETGAIATQARGNLLYGIQGLKLLEQGMPAARVIETLTAGDPLKAERQVGVVDARGGVANYTGEDCLPWAGARSGGGYSIQGNLLAGPAVVDAMAAAFETAGGDFPKRLLQALAAGQAAGGDARGRQSAAILVVRTEGGYMGLTDRYIDLEVEDHPTPIRELERLLRIKLSELAMEEADRLRGEAMRVDGDARTKLLGQGQAQALRAVELNEQNDQGWWLLARLHLLAGREQAAGEAGRRALLLNPAWRTLPAETVRALGVEPELIQALLEQPAFRRLWESLGPEPAAVR